jgi:hypothetical protein
MFGKKKSKDKVVDIVPMDDVEKLTILDLRNDNDMVAALTTDQVFQVLKQSVKENSLPELKAMVESCEILKENLEMTGQTDLLHTLAQRIKESGKEYEILSAGYSFYLYRGDVNDIIDKVNKDKGFKYLKMTRLEDYRKLIPTTVAPLVKDVRKLFSSLYVLHTDPKGEDTVEEKRVNKDKDPILFGMATNKSEKMYFIASWEDKWCDFTLNRLLDEMAARLTKPDAMNFDSIPTTVEELIDSIDKTAGIWNTIRLETHDYYSSSSLPATSTVITYNDLHYVKFSEVEE